MTFITHTNAENHDNSNKSFYGKWEEQLIAADSRREMSKDEFFTITEAANYLHLSVPTIYGMNRNRTIPYYKKSKRCYYLKDDLNAYLRSGRIMTADELRAEAYKR